MTSVYNGAWHVAKVYDPSDNHTGRVRAKFSLKHSRSEAALPAQMRGTPTLTGEATLIEGKLPDTEWFTLKFDDGFQQRFVAEELARSRYRLIPHG